ncbi:hypothetical protein HAZT_HAZT002006 [Hyalella azteca]|uniref:Homeobox domain-containing protein n=1 Tax=Hyalella azteca TaxID=294128 RepID=A0A6A0GYE2_HYAAZ|nr:hypothetical protein HAZT_HAZT002006 [Hyalella azteca]
MALDTIVISPIEPSFTATMSSLRDLQSLANVWFQNRRTKWRKRHAAEMATAKRKQEEATDYEDDDQDETPDHGGGDDHVSRGADPKRS